jgi:hypothetical protein
MSNMNSERLGHLMRFYSIIEMLESNIGGAKKLTDCSGRMSGPKRGVYFFREPGENRADTGAGPRIVRLGTHALKSGSGTKLWMRLSQHKGQQATGGGNHRGSIFRLIVGASLIGRELSTWGDGNSGKGDVKNGELALEREVSLVIGAMPFVWLPLEDEASPESRRGYIERNSIALLSNRSASIQHIGFIKTKSTSGLSIGSVCRMSIYCRPAVV